ncbi:MAG TPA: PSD1 and planctomycete cytochrome C domain-containing protein [Planctomycetaceae bacterium]|nr:PSD1 and planctomycete cytochrome C domain-containing protein [Planctomycetaceae bacterium]
MPRWSASIVVCATASLIVPSAVSAGEKLQFNRDIRPILSNNCYLCHGPDEKHREGGLRLDRSADATAKLESGQTAIVPGDANASELVKRILSTDPNTVMPPPDSEKVITAEQREILKRWVAEGAEYQGHWSFISPQRPTPPAVKRMDLVRNDIDPFLLARLEREGLEPNGEADKVTLIRRVTFDLTGLPPTPAEVGAFVADASPEAYSRLVDRLLDSPRYGEHLGRIWLDAARYGDTHGLHLDNERSLWPYREWVINAFNSNLPFDQFTIHQLAGDLLPNPTREQRIATGFNRCNVTTSEGGSINDEVLVRYASDRTETMGTVWMGLTLNCCACHSHKFDPVTQKEYYSLYAYFNSIADAAMDGNVLLPPPVLKLPTDEQTAKIAELDLQIAATQKTINETLAATKYEDPVLLGAPVDALIALRKDVVWFDDDPPMGANLQGNTPWEFVTADKGPVFSGAKASVRSGEGITQHFFTGANPPLKIGAGDRLFAYVYLDPQNPPKAVMLQFNDGTWEHRVNFGSDQITFGAPNTPAKVQGGPLPEVGKWGRLEVEASQVNLPPGAMLNGWAFTQFGGKAYWDKAGIVSFSAEAGPLRSQLVWEDQERSKPNSTVPAHLLAIIKTAEDKRNPEQQRQLRDYFLQHLYADMKPTFEPLNQKIAELNKQRADIDNQIPATMVAEDLPQPREAFVLVRGAYDKRADKVERAVPAVFPSLPEGSPNNRLGLAQWLVSPQHPLTARVIVNRYWQHYFGTGIVKTAEDFGAQGQWPSNPELLDWLATEFIRTGWDVKAMQKLIVTSGAYRRATKVTPDMLKRDPENVLLARGPRFRLDAETIRDAALSVSGLLVERKGGKSVKPYQPDGVWEAVAFVGSNTSSFKVDSGDALYRRSLYTFWKRTSPPPAMLTMDAPSRENCTVRRPRTNTPLQSLVLMNDVQYVEAARRFAERMMKEGGSQPADRLDYGFRLVTSRKPSPQEANVLQTIYAKHLAKFTQDTTAAEKLLAAGTAPRDASLPMPEHAAYTMAANLLLNLDETITKE